MGEGAGTLFRFWEFRDCIPSFFLDYYKACGKGKTLGPC